MCYLPWVARSKRQRKQSGAAHEVSIEDPGAAELVAGGDTEAEVVEPAADAAATEASPDESDELVGGAEEGADDDTDIAALPDEDCKKLIAALIFASDKPLPLPRIRQLMRTRDGKRVARLVQELVERSQSEGIVLSEVSTGYQYRTNPRFSGWVQHIIAGRPVRLSRAQLETLAICAYRQPITRPEIDEIRGVDSGATLKILLERNLVKILGKREEVGRPILYGTTKEFLDFFSLGDLRDLPTLREFTELSPENQALLERQLPSDEDPSNGEPNGTHDDEQTLTEMTLEDDGLTALEHESLAAQAADAVESAMN